MIKSKTYKGQAGLNYIQSPDLAFAIIYVVKREGTQYDKYISGSTNRTYIHQDSLGRINFLNAFAEGGEKIFVIYKEPSTVQECVAVAMEDFELPNALVGVNYANGFSVSGTSPVSINVITKPSWATVDILLYSVVVISGFPDVAGAETLEFELTNCGGTVSFLKTFDTLENSNNIFISSASSSKIQDVTGIPYAITSGSFPVYSGNNITGVHNGYTGIISVTVSDIVFPKLLRIDVNGTTHDTESVPSNGTYNFATDTFLNTDIIEITLE